MLHAIVDEGAPRDAAVQAVQAEVVCFQLGPRRLRLFALVDRGHAAREDVNDSLFGKRRAGKLQH